MPAPGNVAEFVAVVRKSGLVADDTLRPEVDRLLKSPNPPATPEQMAQALVGAGLITRFQARQLKLGRYKRFTIAGKYRLLELLGVGGMGAVYLCEHMLMKRLVALKVLPTEKMADPANVERFYREARAVAALNDPNIVRAYDIDQAEGLHFLVMEYVDGTSLQEIVARHGPLDPVRAASYIAQAAHGLQHAGELGMVHRDIKPGNLLLERTGVVKILDMGLARFFNDKADNLTSKYDEKCVLGTADYLAPEQAMTNVVDIRADIYALGGTLYFLLAGKSPVPDGTIAQKLVYHQTRHATPVEHVRDDVPAGLLAVLRKMMAKDPADRFQVPEAVAEALAPWADPHLPPPPAREMPDHCPAVLALHGHAADRAKGGSSAARLSGTGRLALLRSAGAGRAAGGPETPSGSGRVALAGPPTEAHADTDRGSPTVPIPLDPPSDPGGGSDVKIDLQHPEDGESAAPRAAAPRRVVRVLAAAAAAGLVAAAAVGTYVALAAKPAPPTGPAPAPPAGPPTDRPAAAITPQEARRHVNQDRTVVFTVAKVGESKGGNLYLNSMTDYEHPENITAFIPAHLARSERLTVEAARGAYEGHVVRVRGVIQPWKKGLQIQINELAQIAVAEGEGK